MYWIFLLKSSFIHFLLHANNTRQTNTYECILSVWLFFFFLDFKNFQRLVDPMNKLKDERGSFKDTRYGTGIYTNERLF